MRVKKSGCFAMLFLLPELLATWGNIVLFLLSVVLAYM